MTIQTLFNEETFRDPSIRSQLADCFLDVGDPQTAEAMLVHVSELLPICEAEQKAVAQVQMAHVYSRLQDDRAIALLQQSMDFFAGCNPSNISPQTLTKFAATCGRLGKFELALLGKKLLKRSSDVEEATKALVWGAAACGYATGVINAIEDQTDRTFRAVLVAILAAATPRTDPGISESLFSRLGALF